MPRGAREVLKRAVVMLSTVSNAYPISPENPRSAETGSGIGHPLTLSWTDPNAPRTGSASINADARMHQNMIRLLGRVHHGYNAAGIVSIQKFTGRPTATDAIFRIASQTKARHARALSQRPNLDAPSNQSYFPPNPAKRKQDARHDKGGSDCSGDRGGHTNRDKSDERRTSDPRGVRRMAALHRRAAGRQHRRTLYAGRRH